MTKEIISKAQERMAHSHQSLAREFGNIRAGRANASLLDRISVEYYGAPTPLNQLAGITIPEARVLLITPFDKSILKDIERAERYRTRTQCFRPWFDATVRWYCHPSSYSCLDRRDT